METTNQVMCITSEVYWKTVHTLGYIHGDIRIDGDTISSYNIF